MALTASGKADPERLAAHFQEAGEFEAAAEYAAVAAAEAFEALAFDRAARLFREAIELSREDAPDRSSLRVKLAEALDCAGRGVDAAQAYLAAAAAAEPAVRLGLKRRAGEQLLRSGRAAAGVPVLSDLLPQVGLTMPETSLRALISMLAARSWLRVRGLDFRQRGDLPMSSRDKLRIDLCSALAKGLGRGDAVRAAGFATRHLLAALATGDPHCVAEGLALEAMFVSGADTRSRRRAEHLLAAAETLARRIGEPYQEAHLQAAAGIVSTNQGRWAAAMAALSRAEALFKDLGQGAVLHSQRGWTGASWELFFVRERSLVSLFFLGEIAKLGRRLPALVQEAEERGDLYAAAAFRLGMGICPQVVWLAADKPDEARRELQRVLVEWPPEQAFDVTWRVWTRAAATDIALYSGESPSVSTRRRATLEHWLRRLTPKWQLWFVHNHFTAARRRLAAAAGCRDTRTHLALLEQAEAEADTIAGEGTHWGQPLSLLIRAGAAVTRGRVEDAVRLLASAEAGFVAADMALHAAVARRRRGELVGGDEGRALADAADAWMGGQSIRNPARITAMLAPGGWAAR